MTDQFHADELPTRAGPEALDRLRFRDYLRKAHDQDYPESTADLVRLLQNLNLATDAEVLNLAGLLLFAEQPERFKPQFVVKAIRYPGNDIHATQYLDSEDFAGPLRNVFDGAIAFIERNLHKVQAGRSVNAPGVPEIPRLVFEELLVNALVHRDYLVSAPIRMFIFDDRIELVSPGHLPDNLTVAKVLAGNSNIRNPILVSHVTKGLLPYRGLGSGIKRALEEWPEIAFADDREGCLFTATIRRRIPASSVKRSVKSSAKGSVKGSVKRSARTDEQILELLSVHKDAAMADVAKALGLSTRAVEKRVASLRKTGRLRRVGPKRGGHWEVASKAK
jgi:ATP-dependent DNA helicase RecG